MKLDVAFLYMMVIQISFCDQLFNMIWKNSETEVAEGAKPSLR